MHEVGWAEKVTYTLTHWGWDKMAAVSQMTFSNAFSWMGSLGFWFEFHWILFLGVQLTITQHWFRQWLGANQATSHYLNQYCPDSLMHKCSTRGKWVKTYQGLYNCTLNKLQTFPNALSRKKNFPIPIQTSMMLIPRGLIDNKSSFVVYLVHVCIYTLSAIT